VAAGIFTLAYKLRDSPQLQAADRELLADSLEWFGKNLDPTDQIQPLEVKGLLSATDARNCLAQGLRYGARSSDAPDQERAGEIRTSGRGACRVEDRYRVRKRAPTRTRVRL
jgi:hypothetical protein